MSARPPRRRTPCQGCERPTFSAISICQRCQDDAAQRPRRECADCGKLHRARRRPVCRDCYERDPYQEGLRGGRWVNVGGIQRWVETSRGERLSGPRPGPRPPCGTEKGYQRHRWEFNRFDIGTWPLPADDPCGCRAAHAAHEAFRVAMKRPESEVA